MGIIDPVGRTVSYTYDTNNYLTNFTNNEGGITDYNYTNGRLVEVVNPNDKSIHIIYTPDSGGSYDDVSISDHNNNVLYSVNVSDFGSVTTDVNLATSSYNYDTRGFTTSVTPPCSCTTTYVRDSMKRVTSVTEPDNSVTSFSYDSNGNQTQTTFFDNKTSILAYNSDN